MHPNNEGVLKLTGTDSLGLRDGEVISSNPVGYYIAYSIQGRSYCRDLDRIDHWAQLLLTC